MEIDIPLILYKIIILTGDKTIITSQNNIISLLLIIINKSCS